MGRYDYGGWSRYVPAAQRRAKAKREMAKLIKKGQDVQPVEIQGLKIARSFWGKGWCDHLESFGDYSNRLPRGRAYVRNGSVCHLSIRKGKVDAIISGSELYRVSVEISPLKAPKWKKLKQGCSGKIGSLVELLQGRLSEEIMGVVTNDKNGLFPRSGEIKFVCNCPDWAGMCKHIAATMYSIGARLDTQPELLFVLRGVDHEELITIDAATQAIVGKGSGRTRRRVLSGKDLAGVFDIELDELPATAPSSQKSKRKPPATRQAKKAAARRLREMEPTPLKPTARSISSLRSRHGMTKTKFAEVIGVTAITVTRWESSTIPLRLRDKSLAALASLDEQEH